MIVLIYCGANAQFKRYAFILPRGQPYIFLFGNRES